MNVLEKIILAKRREVEKLKSEVHFADFENVGFFNYPAPSFKDHLSVNEPSVIAEFKRRSPSKGQFKMDINSLEITKGYEAAGAAAVSILTDVHFDGRKEDIEEVAGKIAIPVLRKDFVIDEIQILEAKAIGASAILLIASVLKKKEVKFLYQAAKKLGLDVLLELHEISEIDKIPAGLEIVGINNRNLSSFEVDIENSIKLAEELPADMIKVSESGINSIETILNLYDLGFDAFLIGENFMKAENPVASARTFIGDLKNSLDR